MTPMKRTPLSQLASVSAGQGAPKDNEFSEIGVPFVRAGSLEALIAGRNESELELVSAETAKLRKLKTYPKGTILFAKSGMSATKDRIYVLQNPAHVVSHLATLIPKDSAHADYLRLALKRFPPSSLIRDSAYPAIGLGEIENFEIDVPEEFDDQIRIARVLGKVEGLIAQRKQHLQQLDELLKSVFLEMFGDPVRNERAWPTKDLDSFIDKNRGISYGIVQRGDNFPGGTPVLRIRDVIAEEYIEEDLVRTEPSNSNKYARTILQGGELLLSIRGTVGAISVAPPQSVGWNVSRELAVIPVSNGVSKKYLAHLLKSPPMQRQFSSMIKGVAQSGLNLSDIRRIGVILPPAELQASYEQIARKIESQVRVYRNSLTDLEALYGALSQQAFKGELDLSRVALPAAPIEGEMPVAAAVPAPITAPVIELPESEFLLPALQDRAQLAPLLRSWLEAYRMQLGSAAFSLERFIAAAQTRLGELHPDNDFELRASDYEIIKAWAFEALAAGALTQAFDDDGNRIELKAADEQSTA